MHKLHLLPIALIAAVVSLTGCSKSSEPAPQASAEAEPLRLVVPAGQYKNDPYHSSLNFSVTHIGLSNYVMRFTDFEVSADIQPDNLTASSLRVEIDPSSIATDYDGDYVATHKQSPYKSWEEDLSQSPKFLNVQEHPQITYQSTSITPTGDGKLKIDGKLTLLGQTHPVTLTAELVGQVAQHPFFGFGALGFSVSGTFERSKFGMTHLTNPPLISDTVTVLFEGELHQVVEKPAS
ncbi:YceI family protein [Litorivivens sp.]|uniref:YceI family protein n=1 Tax=Litorivivens sp. TaxID=2020868 RepID=UPI003562FBCD